MNDADYRLLKHLIEKTTRIEAKLDKLLEKKKPGKPRSSRIDYPDWFEKTWWHYPKRAGSNPKKKAYQAWNTRMKEGREHGYDLSQTIHLGVLEYAKFCKATGKTGTEFVMQAATFFGPDKHYENDWEIPVQADVLPKNELHLEKWAVENGYREARPAESYHAYRQALERLHRG